MKSIIIHNIKTTNKFLWLIVLNFILLIFYYYEGLNIECEQCLPNVYCEPCISDEQYFIVYFGGCLNIIWLIYSIIRDRKSKQLVKTNKVLIFVYFVFVNTLLYLLFKDFQPLCKPCLDNVDCPLCISKEQYFIIYFGIAINVVIGIICLQWFIIKFSKIKRQLSRKYRVL